MRNPQEVLSDVSEGSPEDDWYEQMPGGVRERLGNNREEVQRRVVDNFSNDIYWAVMSSVRSDYRFASFAAPAFDYGHSNDGPDRPARSAIDAILRDRRNALGRTSDSLLQGRLHTAREELEFEVLMSTARHRSDARPHLRRAEQTLLWMIDQGDNSVFKFWLDGYSESLARDELVNIRLILMLPEHLLTYQEKR